MATETDPQYRGMHPSQVGGYGQPRPGPQSGVPLPATITWADHFRATMKEFMPDFRDKQVTSALKRLTIFSFMIICIPLSSMFLSKAYVFEGIFHYNPSDSIVYGAVVAVVLVHVILFGYVYMAWNEPDSSPVPLTSGEKED